MKETRLLGCRVWFFRLFWGFCGFPLGYTREGERDRDAREEGESVGRLGEIFCFLCLFFFSGFASVSGNCSGCWVKRKKGEKGLGRVGADGSRSAGIGLG